MCGAFGNVGFFCGLWSKNEYNGVVFKEIIEIVIRIYIFLGFEGRFWHQNVVNIIGRSSNSFKYFYFATKTGKISLSQNG